MKKKLLILSLFAFIITAVVRAQQDDNFDIVQYLENLENLQDLKPTVLKQYGEPDSGNIQDNLDNVYNFIYNLPGENFSLQIMVLEKSYVLAATLVYPIKYRTRITNFLDTLNYREGKYYKPKTRLFYENYESTEKSEEEFGILIVVEDVEL